MPSRLSILVGILFFGLLCVPALGQTVMGDPPPPKPTPVPVPVPNPQPPPTSPPAAPTSITVPATSSDGVMAVNCPPHPSGSGIGVYFQYDRNPSFGNPSGMWGNIFGQATITVTVNGTYYFRARNVNAAGPSPWTVAANPCVVSLLPRPDYVTVPGSSSTGSYVVSWAAVAGATGYELKECNDPSLISVVGVYPYPASVLAVQVTGRGNGTWYYSVRAVFSGTKGPWRNAANGCVVDLRPQYPTVPGVTVPARSLTGQYTVTWGSAAGATAYDVFEDTRPWFPNPVCTRVATTSLSVTHAVEATYYYRVRGVFSGTTGKATDGGNGCEVVLRGRLTVAKGPLSPVSATVVAGTGSVPVLQLALATNVFEDVTVDSLRLSAAGTLDDASGLDGLCLHLDADGDGALDPEDALIAGPEAFASDDGTALFQAVGRTVPAGGSETWLVVCDVSQAATWADVFQVGLTTSDHVTVSGPSSQPPLVAGSFPLWGAKYEVSNRGSLHASSLQGAGGSDLAVGGAPSVLLGITFSAGPPEAVSVTRLVFRVEGSALDGGEAAAFSLYLDWNGNGILDAVDRLLHFPVQAGAGDLCFENVGVLVPASGRTGVLLCAEAPAGALEGQTLRAGLDSADHVSAVGESLGTDIACSGLPLTGADCAVAAVEPPAEPPAPEPVVSDDAAGGCCARPASAVPAESVLGFLLPFLALVAGTVVLAGAGTRRS